MKIRFIVTVEGLHRDTKPYRVQTLACVELTRAEAKHPSTQTPKDYDE